MSSNFSIWLKIGLEEVNFIGNYTVKTVVCSTHFIEATPPVCDHTTAV